MFKYSIGNHKIGKDTLIFNMGPAQGCPSAARGLCQVPAGKCYALKAERCYPGCLPYRKAQAKYWRNSEALDIAADVLTAIKKHKAVKYIRVNEAGDFYDQNDVRKLCEVASRVPEAVFYVYTARKDLRWPGWQPGNLIANGSGFMLDNNFKYEAEKFDVVCPGDCRDCNVCKVPGKKTIKIEAH